MAKLLVFSGNRGGSCTLGIWVLWGTRELVLGFMASEDGSYKSAVPALAHEEHLGLDLFLLPVALSSLPLWVEPFIPISR